MRKTIFAFASAFILLTTFSCGKDKDDNATIQGKWSAKSAHVKSYVNNTLVSDSTITFSSSEALEFKNDGTLLSTDEDGSVDTYTYTYDANSKILTTTDEDNELSNSTVTKLTSSDLTLHGEETDTFDGIPYKAITDIYLKR